MPEAVFVYNALERKSILVDLPDTRCRSRVVTVQTRRLAELLGLVRWDDEFDAADAVERSTLTSPCWYASSCSTHNKQDSEMTDNGWWLDDVC